MRYNIKNLPPDLERVLNIYILAKLPNYPGARITDIKEITESPQMGVTKRQFDVAVIHAPKGSKCKTKIMLGVSFFPNTNSFTVKRADRIGTTSFNVDPRGEIS